MDEMKTRYTASEVKEYGFGRFLSVISSLAPQLSGACNNPGAKIKCPCHGTTDGFRLFKNANERGGGVCQLEGVFPDIFSLLMWANGWTFKEALHEVARFLGMDGREFSPATTRARERRAVDKIDRAKQRKRLTKIWGEAVHDNGRIAQYFDHRGLSLPVPETLKLHRNLGYWEEGKKKGYFPAMLAQLKLGDKFVGLHITYLSKSSEGPAPVKVFRKTRRCDEEFKGATIQLYKPMPGEPLGIGEGLESSLAVRELTGLPMWSGANTFLLESAQFPAGIESVYIAADLDENSAGEKAANKLKERLIEEGRTVGISYPELGAMGQKSSYDWNDYIVVKERKVS